MALQEEMEKQGNFLFKHRSKLPLLMLPAALGIFIYQEYIYLERSDWFMEQLFPYVCLLVSLTGLFIRGYTVGRAAKKTSGRNTYAGQIAEKLNTTGIYSTVRHPLYLGNFIIWLGIAMLTENMWFVAVFVLAFWLYYERIMFAEEQFLRRKFKESYTSWADKTPAFFPSFKNYSPGTFKFNFRKVIRREKNGLFAIFILFFLFQYSEDIVQRASFAIVWDFWVYALITTGLIYLFIKILRKRTQVLSDLQ
jgi:protein-S-isoprenylcysteine O-methyltransferase Ste14